MLQVLSSRVSLEAAGGRQASPLAPRVLLDVSRQLLHEDQPARARELDQLRQRSLDGEHRVLTRRPAWLTDPALGRLDRSQSSLEPRSRQARSTKARHSEGCSHAAAPASEGEDPRRALAPGGRQGSQQPELDRQLSATPLVDGEERAPSRLVAQKKGQG